MFEVEKRSFISEDKYNELISHFKSHNYYLKEERQITYYFQGNIDFRLMNSSKYLKMWLKKGNLHDDIKEEMSVIIDKKYETDLLKMLVILGYEVEIKWFRKRLQLTYRDFEVTLDYSIGYGFIIEFKLMINNELDIDKAKKRLEDVFIDFGINTSSKEEFTNKYNDYKENWENYTKGINEEEFLKEV